jgi:hypothetical protein
MKLFLYCATVVSLVLSASESFAVCVDFDGSGRCIETGPADNVPMPTGIERVSPGPKSSGNSTRSSHERQVPAPKAAPHASSGPSLESIVGGAIVGSLVGGIIGSIFESPAPPPGPTAAEIAAQMQREEQERQEAARRHDSFLRSKSDLSGKLRGPGTTYVADNAITATAGGIQLKTIPAPVLSNNTHRGFFGQPVTTPQIDSEGRSLLSPDDYRKAISNPNLTQEERERLLLMTKVAPTQLGDHPMIDSRAFVEKERYSDPYLDIAAAGVKGGGTTLAISMVDDRGKRILKTRGIEDGYDQIVSSGRSLIENPKTTAEKAIALGDFALTKAPPWAVTADVAANATGGVVRQSFVRYWAANDNKIYWEPRPMEKAMLKWDNWYSDQGEWTRAALDRVGAGAYKK